MINMVLSEINSEKASKVCLGFKPGAAGLKTLIIPLYRLWAIALLLSFFMSLDLLNGLSQKEGPSGDGSYMKIALD